MEQRYATTQGAALEQAWVGIDIGKHHHHAALLALLADAVGHAPHPLILDHLEEVWAVAECSLRATTWVPARLPIQPSARKSALREGDRCLRFAVQ
ncbi:hypothetical protein ACQP1O_28530 [Nocardia sp. CA-151230]|uniref:hypothetical protein n=1 Tax=Nocardia sp. CA-151230 TaxID=3239982 RepID=UPI003D8E584A